MHCGMCGVTINMTGVTIYEGTWYLNMCLTPQECDEQQKVSSHGKESHLKNKIESEHV